MQRIANDPVLQTIISPRDRADLLSKLKRYAELIQINHTNIYLTNEEGEKMNEIWKPIDGYENYQVSNMGNVMNIITGKVLKTHNNGRGYLHVILYDKNHNGRTSKSIFTKSP